MKSFCRKKVFFALFLLSSLPAVAQYEDSAGSYSGTYNKTLGGSVYGSFQLVNTLPELDAGIGGGMYFDYRFNQRFSLMAESLFTIQDGNSRSAGEGEIISLILPALTFKIYLFESLPRFDPYVGLGLGVYGLTEGSLSNNTGGFGLGAQVELGTDFAISNVFVVSTGATYRSAGLINSFSGSANATTYMPLTLFGRVGYRF